jgi:hypothetical protein
MRVLLDQRHNITPTTKSIVTIEPTTIPTIAPVPSLCETGGLLEAEHSDVQELEGTRSNPDFVEGVVVVPGEVEEAVATTVEVGLEPRLLSVHS